VAFGWQHCDREPWSSQQPRWPQDFVFAKNRSAPCLCPLPPFGTPFSIPALFVLVHQSQKGLNESLQKCKRHQKTWGEEDKGFWIGEDSCVLAVFHL
jgi:hypothetical protein